MRKAVLCAVMLAVVLASAARLFAQTQAQELIKTKAYDDEFTNRGKRDAMRDQKEAAEDREMDAVHLRIGCTDPVALQLGDIDRFEGELILPLAEDEEGTARNIRVLEGLGNLNQGQDQWDAGNFALACDHFAAASERFNTSNTHYHLAIDGYYLAYTYFDAACDHFIAGGGGQGGGGAGGGFVSLQDHYVLPPAPRRETLVKAEVEVVERQRVKVARRGPLRRAIARLLRRG